MKIVYPNALNRQLNQNSTVYTATVDHGRMLQNLDEFAMVSTRNSYF